MEISFNYIRISTVCDDLFILSTNNFIKKISLEKNNSLKDKIFSKNIFHIVFIQLRTITNLFRLKSIYVSSGSPFFQEISNR